MPFVIRYPQEIPAGKRNKDMILNIDFPALMLDYARIPQHESFQGKSFRKNLYSETPTQWRDKMYYRYYAHALNRPAHFGIRTQRYKLIFWSSNQVLFQGCSRYYLDWLVSNSQGQQTYCNGHLRYLQKFH